MWSIEDVEQETGLGHGRLPGPAQAQEHRRAVSGLCAAARAAQRCARRCKSNGSSSRGGVRPCTVGGSESVLLVGGHELALLSGPHSTILSPQSDPALAAARQALHRRAAL